MSKTLHLVAEDCHLSPHFPVFYSDLFLPISCQSGGFCFCFPCLPVLLLLVLLFNLKVVSNSWVLRGLQPTRLLCPGDFPGKNIGVGCHYLLHGIFPTPGIKSGFPALAGRFLTTEPQWEALWNPVVYKMLVFLPSGPCPQFSAHTHLPSCWNNFSGLYKL